MPIKILPKDPAIKQEKPSAGRKQSKPTRGDTETTPWITKKSKTTPWITKKSETTPWIKKKMKNRMKSKTTPWIKKFEYKKKETSPSDWIKRKTKEKNPWIKKKSKTTPWIKKKSKTDPDSRQNYNIGGRANLLEEMGRIDARRHPDAADRAEKRRVIGELNKGYKSGGAVLKGKKVGCQIK